MQAHRLKNPHLLLPKAHHNLHHPDWTKQVSPLLPLRMGFILHATTHLQLRTKTKPRTISLQDFQLSPSPTRCTLSMVSSIEPKTPLSTIALNDETIQNIYEEDISNGDLTTPFTIGFVCSICLTGKGRAMEAFVRACLHETSVLLDRCRWCQLSWSWKETQMWQSVKLFHEFQYTSPEQFCYCVQLNVAPRCSFCVDKS
jgi:hypothetical protein